MRQVRELKDPLAVLEKLMKLIVRLAHCGLIHGDFNEFNLMIDDAGHITMIGQTPRVSRARKLHLYECFQALRVFELRHLLVGPR